MRNWISTILLILAGLRPLYGTNELTHTRASGANPDWPTQIYEEPLAPTVMTESDTRFTRSFPGAIRKFRIEGGEVLVRWVAQPTRLLHPAVDCFRGLGYRIHHDPIRVDSNEHRWGCFTAEKRGSRLKVCERVYDQWGGEFTDVSAWYWSAVLGKSKGPWWTVTIARTVPLDPVADY